MKSIFPEKFDQLTVFTWLIHRINEEFLDNAILKGGFVLNLLDSPRYTNDVDYLFVPYRSKKDIVKKLGNILAEIPNAKIEMKMHSTSLRYNINIDKIKIQIEASTSLEAKSEAISTSTIAKKTNQLGQIIRIMSLDHALAHKLAAWNERRLARDLYDIYFLFKKLQIKPNIEVLKKRLESVNSRIPRLKTIKQMSLSEFINQLKLETKKISAVRVEQELSGLLDLQELSGLAYKLIITMNDLIEVLETEQKH
ncbi:MAG: nucleotidyl transferase AbiEii/AbiGii toxin family protein [Pseudomonadota bacterium]